MFLYYYVPYIFSKYIDNVDENKDDDDKESDNIESDGEWWTKLSKELLKDNESNDDKYPKDWCYEGGLFSLICCTNLRYISETAMIGGNDFSKNNGKLRLVYTKYSDELGRKDYLKFMTKIENGEHLNDNRVKYVDISEIVMEPCEDGALKELPMDVDGERRPTEVIYAKILPNKFNIIE